jgi:hypothetical protein
MLRRLLLALVLGALGCGGQTSVDPDPGDAGSVEAGPSQEKACADYVHAYCAKQNECWPLFVMANYGDVGQCESIGCEECANGYGSRTGITPAGLEACGASYAEVPCTDVLNRVNGSPACDPLRGTVEVGDVCESSWECAKGCCVYPTGESCPVCTAKVPAGGACTRSFDCDTALLCSRSGKCTSPNGSGGRCDATQPCRMDLVCRSGSCGAYADTGATCDPQLDDCDPFKGLFCNAKTSQCEPLKIAHPGEPCGYIDGYPGSYAICVAGSDCAMGLESTGTCNGPLAIGEACDPNKFPACAYPAVCIARRCALPDSTCR